MGWDQQAHLAGENGWHKWEEDGIAAATESVANVGTFFIPAANIGKVVVVGTKVGSFVVRVGANVAEFVIPAGSHLVSGVVKIVNFTSTGVKFGFRGLIDAIRETHLNVTVKPTTVPGTLNTALDVTHLDAPVSPGTSVSDALGLETVKVKPGAATDMVGDSSPFDRNGDVDGVRESGPSAPEGAPDGGPDGDEGAPDGPAPSNDSGNRGDGNNGSGNGYEGSGHDGGGDAGGSSGITPEDQARIDRYEQLINATNPDGTPVFDDWVRRMWEGEIFNIENHHRYPVNELHVTKPGASTYSRVDSFIPDQEVVSRKNTQLSEVTPGTTSSYLNELVNKYGLRRDDIVIADTPTNRRDLENAGYDPDDYIGESLDGAQVLEVPVQKNPPALDFLLKADELDIDIRDVEGTRWVLSDDRATVVEIHADGTVIVHPEF
ncbi:hypothetical protein [Microbacterium natoriense]